MTSVHVTLELTRQACAWALTEPANSGLGNSDMNERSACLVVHEAASVPRDARPNSMPLEGPKVPPTKVAYRTMCAVGTRARVPFDAENARATRELRHERTNYKIGAE